MCFSDESLQPIGGLRTEIGAYLRYALSEEDKGRCIQSKRSKKSAYGNILLINLLELLGVVMTAWVKMAAGGRGGRDSQSS